MQCAPIWQPLYHRHCTKLTKAASKLAYIDTTCNSVCHSLSYACTSADYASCFKWLSKSSLSHHLKVRAGTEMERYMREYVCSCCFHAEESGIDYAFGPQSSATLQFRGSSATNYVNLIVWPLIGAAVAIVLGVLCLFHCIKKIKGMMKKPHYDPIPPPDETELNVCEHGKVYLVASTEEEEWMNKRIRHLCEVLAGHGLRAVYYEYVMNDGSAESPLALGMNRWVELQFRRCEFVLFVCTRRFVEEWNGERRDILSPLVYPCRNLLYESLARPQNNSRFAVLFMGDEHVRNVPPILGRFRQFDIYQEGSEAIRAHSLIYYLLEVPPFVPPRVVNFSRQLA